MCKNYINFIKRYPVFIVLATITITPFVIEFVYEMLIINYYEWLWVAVSFSALIQYACLLFVISLFCENTILLIAFSIALCVLMLGVVFAELRFPYAGHLGLSGLISVFLCILYLFIYSKNFRDI